MNARTCVCGLRENVSYVPRACLTFEIQIFRHRNYRCAIDRRATEFKTHLKAKFSLLAKTAFRSFTDIIADYLLLSWKKRAEKYRNLEECVRLVYVRILCVRVFKDKGKRFEKCYILKNIETCITKIH